MAERGITLKAQDKKHGHVEQNQSQVLMCMPQGTDFSTIYLFKLIENDYKNIDQCLT